MNRLLLAHYNSLSSFPSSGLFYSLSSSRRQSIGPSGTVCPLARLNTSVTMCTLLLFLSFFPNDHSSCLFFADGSYRNTRTTVSHPPEVHLGGATAGHFEARREDPLDGQLVRGDHRVRGGRMPGTVDRNRHSPLGAAPPLPGENVSAIHLFSE